MGRKHKDRVGIATTIWILRDGALTALNQSYAFHYNRTQRDIAISE